MSRGGRRYIIPPKKDNDGEGMPRRYIIPPRRKSDDDRLDDERRVDFSDVQKIEGSSTQNKGVPGESGVSGGSVMTNTPDSPDSPGSPRISVDSKSLSDVKQTLKFLGREYLSDEHGHKVKVDVYDTGVEEVINGDRAVTRRRLKFVVVYRDVVRECVTDAECKDAVAEVAKATYYKVSKSAILGLISELKEKYGDERSLPLIEYVKERYPDRLAELDRDPFSWVLKRTSYIVGYERLKLLTLLAVVTSRLRRVPGMSRLHLLLVGPSGAGKSSTVKSVLSFLSDDVVIGGTRLTQNALGYLNVDTLDGRILFIEQIDRQNFNYVREAMTEDKICTVVTEKVVDAEGNERHVARERCIPGQPVVISTSVVDKIDADREQFLNRFLKVYVDPRSVNTEDVVRAILDRRPAEVDQADRTVYTAWLLSRPDRAEVSEDVKEKIAEFVRRLSELTREPVTRVTEVIRNLVVAVAVARGKTVADRDDLEFVLDRFELDILFNGLGLTERDVEFLSVLPDDGGLKTNDVADALRVSKQYALNVLKELERKGLVEGNKEDGKTFTWFLTAFGKRVKSLLTDKGVVELRDERGEVVGLADGPFRPHDDAGGNRQNAVRGPDGRGVPGDEGKAQGVSEVAVLEKIWRAYRLPEDGLTAEEREVADRLVGEGLVQKYGIYYQLTAKGTERLSAPADVREAYEWLKRRGPTPVAEFVDKFGADVLEALKRKDLVTFNVVGNEEYVYPK